VRGLVEIDLRASFCVDLIGVDERARRGCVFRGFKCDQGRLLLVGVGLHREQDPAPVAESRVPNGSSGEQVLQLAEDLCPGWQPVKVRSRVRVLRVTPLFDGGIGRIFKPAIFVRNRDSVVSINHRFLIRDRRLRQQGTRKNRCQDQGSHGIHSVYP